MNSKKIDILNIGLIFISLLLAFKLPFELFLFSYAVLGPLHYLTEINWLRDRSYFIKDRKWVWMFITVALIISVPQLAKMPLLGAYAKKTGMSDIAAFISRYHNIMLLLLLLFAVALVYFKKNRHVLLSFFVSIIAAVLILKYLSFTMIVVAVFLPTIIHVYLFTLLFMLFGALTNKSKPGIAASVFLLLCPLIIFIGKIDATSYVISDYTRSSFDASSFKIVNAAIARILSPVKNEGFQLLSPAGLKIQVFLAFCYTYHYLNWFSKTTVIGWNKILSAKKIAIILMIWITSIFLYWYNYKVGFTALFFLSMIHVVLEFPLNVISIKGILSKLRKPGPGLPDNGINQEQKNRHSLS